MAEYTKTYIVTCFECENSLKHPGNPAGSYNEPPSEAEAECKYGEEYQDEDMAHGYKGAEKCPKFKAIIIPCSNCEKEIPMIYSYQAVCGALTCSKECAEEFDERFEKGDY